MLKPLLLASAESDDYACAAWCERRSRPMRPQMLVDLIESGQFLTATYPS